MALFKRKDSRPPQPTLSAGQREQARHPYSTHLHYTPLTDGSHRLYDAMREAVPVIDAAITKTVRLCGGFHIECENKHAERAVNYALNYLPVGSSGRGIQTFVSSYLDQLITHGTAVGEMVMSPYGDVAALYNVPLRDVELMLGENPLDVRVCSCGGRDTPREVPNQDLVLLSSLSPRPGEIKGISILKGLPFMVDILMKIYNTIGVNFERLGNARFAVTYNPGSDPQDKARAGERAAQMAEEWKRAMRSDSISDFVAMGDVSIKVIGADNHLLDTNVPVRQIMEQIVAKMGVPPFMLGLSWSSTERMSAQQADMLTSELEHYRSLLSPVVRRIARVWLAANGFAAEPIVRWNHINLQDEIELSRARLLRAQARELEEKLPKETEYE